MGESSDCAPEYIFNIAQTHRTKGNKLENAKFTKEGEVAQLLSQSVTLFAEATLAAGATIPFDATVEERALYVVDGEIEIGSERFAAGRLLVFRPGDPISLTATSQARVVLLGGAAMDGPRHIWWNFVSSHKERIEQAKQDWKLGRFAPVPGDTEEFIPLPE